jgi:hypothetical protein
MSELEYLTNLGDEVSVTVFFDYQEGQKETHTDPAFDPELTINAVCVNGEDDSDIQAVLSEKVIASLELECIESVIAGQD